MKGRDLPRGARGATATVATRPLTGYGTNNVVTRDEFHAACEAAP